MSNLNQHIQALLDQLALDNHFPPYLYNFRSRVFDPDKDSVYYAGPYWDQEELMAILASVLGGQWLAAGERVREFEQAFSRMFHVGHSVMVNSGSSANLVMVQGIKKYYEWDDQDEIILSPVGFPTTIAPVVQSGLKPVFCDIDSETLDLDVRQIESVVTPRTRALFISPVLGNSPDMDQLRALTQRYGIALLLDNCDSLGSRWDGRYLSDYALASSCSFYPAHHITTGEGGMVSSSNRGLIDLVRSLASWGRDCTCVGKVNLSPNGACGHRFDRWLPLYDGVIDHKYIYSNMGYNLKPLDLQGAVGLAQLKKFPEIFQKRRLHKGQIQALFARYVPDCRFLDERNDKAQTSWFGVAIQCSDGTFKERLCAHLEGNRIQTRNYFAGNILLHPGYAHLGQAADFPHANEVLKTVFFVGCSPSYTHEVMHYLERVLKEFGNR
ncbi:MAG: DegT/DnrJ/EryC1/StrS family aminotransferase [Nitrospirae bacterium]|nr:DegT/DnrJ/EryC1/StrS family aminotransferase [Magnetococcales bacterium]